MRGPKDENGDRTDGLLPAGKGLSRHTIRAWVATRPSSSRAHRGVPPSRTKSTFQKPRAQIAVKAPPLRSARDFDGIVLLPSLFFLHRADGRRFLSHPYTPAAAVVHLRWSERRRTNAIHQRSRLPPALH